MISCSSSLSSSDFSTHPVNVQPSLLRRLRCRETSAFLAHPKTNEDEADDDEQWKLSFCQHVKYKKRWHKKSFLSAFMGKTKDFPPFQSFLSNGSWQ